MTFCFYVEQSVKQNVLEATYLFDEGLLIRGNKKTAGYAGRYLIGLSFLLRLFELYPGKLHNHLRLVRLRELPRVNYITASPTSPG
jgi:hypothetical protein